MTRKLPPGLVLTFYGDDLTGSTSTMEALAFSGLPTVMFLDPPTPQQRARFAEYRAIGIAGIARSQTPEWMDDNLPGIFTALAAMGAPVVHHKICSTFDSAPTIGSIGRAIEIAAPIVGGDWHPLLVAAPVIGRYQAFGTLFAPFAGAVHRLDRHPSMSRHPVTPMREADVRRHLAQQTQMGLGLVDLAAMKRGEGDVALDREIAAGARVVALDVVDDETLAEAGRLIWERGGERCFAIGSQGIEYALTAYWRAAGLLAAAPPPPCLAGVERIACVSGSCAPVTAGQIAHACAHGFAPVRLEAARAVDAADWRAAIGEASHAALAALGEGRDPLIHTATGPDDPALAAFATAVETSGASLGAINDRIGDGLGRILDAVMGEAGLARGVIAGGDTSSHAARAMGINAFTALAPIAPGAPLCRGFSDDPARDGRHLVLKGGQIGAVDFFTTVRRGGIQQ